MITTRNRSEALERTCEIIAALNPPPVEVICTADGCADDTTNVIRRHLPQATVIINESARGSVGCRDVMMRQAKADLVFALDDDSYPEQMDCIAVVRRFFEENPKLAVLHFPQRSDEYPETLSQKEFGHVDALLVKAGSGALTHGQPSSAGVPRAFADLTISLPFNDVESLRKTFQEKKNQSAAVISEPIPANAGLYFAQPNFDFCFPE